MEVPFLPKTEPPFREQNLHSPSMPDRCHVVEFFQFCLVWPQRQRPKPEHKSALRRGPRMRPKLKWRGNGNSTEFETYKPKPWSRPSLRTISTPMLKPKPRLKSTPKPISRQRPRPRYMQRPQARERRRPRLIAAKCRKRETKTNVAHDFNDRAPKLPRRLDLKEIALLFSNFSHARSNSKHGRGTLNAEVNNARA